MCSLDMCLWVVKVGHCNSSSIEARVNNSREGECLTLNRPV